MDSKFYVSPEAEELLKEKGCYIEKDAPIYNKYGDVIGCYPADIPTKAEAIDWLESKGIIVIVYYYKGEWLHLFTPLLSEIEDKLIKKVFIRESFTTRLEAEEAAIIKALELL